MYRVMLADDEGIVLDSLKMIIEKHFPGQCQMETAKTGRDVIELAESFRPDIAFMDIQMPGINGIDAIRRSRRATLLWSLSSCPPMTSLIMPEKPSTLGYWNM